jgi:hypothetical protein
LGVCKSTISYKGNSLNYKWGYCLGDVDFPSCSIPSQMLESVVLKPGERTIDLLAIDGTRTIGDKVDLISGYMISSNMRFIYIESSGIFNIRYHVKDIIDFNQVHGISIMGWLIKTPTLTYDIHGQLCDMGFTGCRLVDSKSLKKQNEIKGNDLVKRLQFLITNGLHEMDLAKKKERIQYVIDFSFLKKELEKGGLMVQTVKCPSCMASLTLPPNGNSFQCQYCNSTVYAQDVFDKMKGIIKGL